MTPHWLSRFAVLTALCVICSAAALIPAADQPTVNQKQSLSPEHAKQRAAGLELFKKEVKQILVARCVKCHGGEKTEAELEIGRAHV